MDDNMDNNMDDNMDDNKSAASMKGARLAPHSHGTSHSHSGRVAENLWKPVGF